MAHSNSLGAFHYGGRDFEDEPQTARRHHEEAFPDRGQDFEMPLTSRRHHEEAPAAALGGNGYPPRRDEDLYSHSDFEDSESSAAWAHNRSESPSPQSPGQRRVTFAEQDQTRSATVSSPHGVVSEPDPVPASSSPTAGYTPDSHAWNGGWPSTVREEEDEDEEASHRSQGQMEFQDQPAHSAYHQDTYTARQDPYDYGGRDDVYEYTTGTRASPTVTGYRTSGVSPSPAAAYLMIPEKPVKPDDDDKMEEGMQGVKSQRSMSQKTSQRCAKLRYWCGRPPYHIARCPVAFALCWFLFFVTLATLGLVFWPPTLETNFDTFTQADVNSSLMYDAFIAATREVAGRSERRLQQVGEEAVPFQAEVEDGQGRRLQTNALMMYRIYDLSVAYELKDKRSVEGLWQKKILRDIRDFENQLRSLPEWQDLCSSVEERHKRLCDPGMSWVNYALPTQNRSTAAGNSIVPSSFVPDGQGPDVLPLDAVYYVVSQRNLQELFLPKTYVYSRTNGPQYMRSSFRFKVPCCTNLAPLAVRRSTVAAMDARWDVLSSDVLLDLLQSSFQSSRDSIRVWWEGTGFDTLEVLQVLWQDIRLAAGAVVVVLLYLAFHTRSLLLTVAGFLVIPLSLPVAYCAYLLISGSRILGVINFLSAFIIIGLGADVVFIYTDTWKDSAFQRDSEAGRLAWTYSNAGKATLATTATTALAFLANLASVLRQLREFGLFMGLCVFFAWILVSLIFVPLCLADEKLAMRSVMYSAAPKTERKMATAFGHWSFRLAIMRHPCCCIPCVLAIVFIILSLIFAEIGTGISELFPANHNRNRGIEVFREFKAGDLVLPLRFLPPPEQENVCSNNMFGTLPPGTPKNCILHWCLVRAADPVTTSNTSCTCYVKRQVACNTDGANTVRIRLAGVSAVSDDDLKGAISDYVQRPGIWPLRDWVVAGGAQSLLQQDWEVGSFGFTPVVEVVVPLSPTNCGWDDQCFCGVSTCYADISDGWTLQGKTIGLTGNAPAAARRLQVLPQEEWQVDPARRVSVEMVFGIEIIPDPPLLKVRDMANSWQFVDGFDFREPWIQRHIYKMCTEFPPELRIVVVNCWILDFFNFLQTKPTLEERRFPVAPGKFEGLLAEFSESGTTGNGLSKHFYWLRNGQMMASFVSFQCDVDRFSGIDKAMEYKELWDNHVNRANFYGPSYIEDTRYWWAKWPMRGAFHVSWYWASSEAHSALVSSTLLTLTIVLLLAFLTMLLFTGNCCLSLLVVWATIEVISGLFFFMVFIMGWKIGPIEVLALIVFVGYALDYSLHVAQKFGSPEAREAPLAQSVVESPHIQDHRLRSRLQRVTYALKAIGGANLGSAVTTCGCALFLIFCQLAVFKKLGIVVVVVTLLSIAVAFSALPAMLLLVGPLRNAGRCCCSREGARAGIAKSRHLAKHPKQIPGAVRSWFFDPGMEESMSLKDEAKAYVKEEEEDTSKTRGLFGSGGASWRRRRLGLETCFEGKGDGHEMSELSLGLQAARITADPILEVSRYNVEEKTVHARSVVALDPRPSAVPPTWQAMRALTNGPNNNNNASTS